MIARPLRGELVDEEPRHPSVVAVEVSHERGAIALCVLGLGFQRIQPAGRLRLPADHDPFAGTRDLRYRERRRDPRLVRNECRILIELDTELGRTRGRVPPGAAAGKDQPPTAECPKRPAGQQRLRAGRAAPATPVCERFS